MSAITAAIFTKMNTDGTLTALLGTRAGNPCVFTGQHIPGDAPRPFVSAMPVTDAEFAYKTNTGGREVSYDIACIADKEDGFAALETIGERVRTLFDHGSLTVTGFNTVEVTATGPTEQPTSDNLLGLRVSVSVVLEKA